MKPLKHKSRKFWKLNLNDLFLAPGLTAVVAAATIALNSLALTSAEAADPIITEFMASNSETLILGGGATPDWIELHNPGGTELDLAGWHLTDNSLDLTTWTFPAGATIAAGGYLLVYADNIIGPAGEYHTNFKLSDIGEYLALVKPDGTILQEFSPTYPQQYSDVSYGITTGGASYAYFQTPTPGAVNNASILGFVKDTTFSHKRGFYDATFQLDITTATPGATIFYTTDGSDPGPTSTSVAAPDPASPPVLSLSISSTAIVRAYAVKTGYESTNIDTQTYIFPDQIIAAPYMSTSITGDPVWGPQMRDALLEIPSISLVTQEVIPDTNPGEPDPYLEPDEVHVSIEMIFPDGRDGFQHNAAIERFGGQYTVYDKQNLRVSFKSELNGDPADPIDGPKRLKFDLFGDTPYGGDTAVTSFDQIILRNGSHDSLFSTEYSFSRGSYTRARYFSDRQIEMGNLSMRGRFVHVYLNGVYNGQYHLMERPTADFMATHQGGEEADYDIMKGRSGIKAKGDAAAQANAWSTWNTLTGNLGNYNTVQANMDVDNYIDYMLLNFYGGNDHDWYSNHNWVAGRKHVGGKYQFFMWDNDFLNRNGGSAGAASQSNTLNNGGPGGMWNSLKAHLEFRMRVADRAQKHFFNGGMLTPVRVDADFTELGERISRTVIPEIARWTDVAAGSYDPNTFQASIDWITDVNGPDRTDIVLDQMRADGVFPDTDAPIFNQHGGFVGPGTPITMATDVDQIYYTLDGSDPRLTGGAPNPGATLATFSGGSPTAQTFIDTGYTWKYLDDGTNQGTAWKEIGFVDSAWQSGPSQLGYGTDGEGSGTELSYGPDSNAKYTTTYFRTTVTIANPAQFSDFLLRMKYDDGAAVYINGTKVIRTSNLPDGATYNTYASWLANEDNWRDFTLPSSTFVAGVNTIAVEVHQDKADSSDMRLDMFLGGQVVGGGGGGGVSDPVFFSAPTPLRARAYDTSTGEWSALNEANFLIGTPATKSNLVISKIHYHPSVAQGDLAEYVELMNISDQPVNLSGVTFSEGISYWFAERDTLAPGQRAVLVADPAAFQAAYGSGPEIFGTYASRLSDGGERVTLSDAGGLPLQSLRYDDNAPWPTEPDGGGYSLVLLSPESAPDHELAQNWRASVNPGGDAGASDLIPFLGDPATDLLAYALGDPAAIEATTINGIPVIKFPRVIGADDVTVTVEVSNDLLTWTAGEAVFLDQSERVGNTIVMHWAFSINEGDYQFARLSISENE